MHRSLLLLSWLRFGSQFRKLRRTLATPKGIFLTLIGAGFFSLMLLPYLMTRVVGTPVPPQEVPRLTWFLHPAALFCFWIFSVVSGHFRSPIAFSLPEVEFLFPGPFRRRELLVYKLCVSTLGTLGFAVFMPIVLPMVWGPAALVGIWIMLTFMQWSTILLTLAASWLGARYRYVLVGLVTALLAVITVSIWQSGAFGDHESWVTRAQAVEASQAVRTMLAPFAVFSRAIGAQALAEAVPWVAGGLAMNLVVAAGILSLDRHFLEASLDASRRRAEMIEHIKRSGGMPSFTRRSRPRTGLPSFPRLAGAGTIAWRQALEMMRGSGRLVFVAAVAIGPGGALVAASQRGSGAVPEVLVLSVTMVLGLLITSIIPLGLRTDLEHVDVIKTLPIRAGNVVWGSLGASILYVLALQAIATFAIAATVGHWSLGMTGALALAVPVNMLTIATDSALVLLFPAVRRFAPGDLLVGVRVALVNFAKILLAAIAAAAAGLVLLAGRLLIPDWPLATLSAAWLVLMLEGLLLMWVVTWLFSRYDPSAHVLDTE